MQYYNITVRALNQLGSSATSAFLRVQTNNVPITRSDLPLIESAVLTLGDNNLHYRLDNLTFQSMKVPLCLRIEIVNDTNIICQRIVTASGSLDFNDKNGKDIRNVSLCLDQYDDYCGESVDIEISKSIVVIS